MDDPPYIPTFKKIARIIEIIQEHGNLMHLFELKDLVKFDIDCPLTTTALMADPRIKVCRKRNIIRFYPKYEAPRDSPEWEQQFKTGVPKRCLDVYGNLAAQQRMADGQFVLVKDFIEDEQVWFSHQPRAVSLPLQLADRLIEIQDKK